MKLNRTQIFGGAVLVILVGVGIWYVYSNAEKDSVRSEPVIDAVEKVVVSPTSTSAKKTETPVNFRDIVHTLHAGDTVGSMKVVSVEPFRSSYGELGPGNVRAVFSGTATVEGTYSYYYSAFDGAWILDFTPVTNSMELPFIDPSYAVFRFSNQEEAERLFGITQSSPQEGKARIQIEEYTLVSYPSEVVDRATIVSVE